MIEQLAGEALSLLFTLALAGVALATVLLAVGGVLAAVEGWNAGEGRRRAAWLAWWYRLGVAAGRIFG